jgi:hypothetical protein
MPVGDGAKRTRTSLLGLVGLLGVVGAPEVTVPA